MGTRTSSTGSRTTRRDGNPPSVDVVVPTTGRHSLHELLRALADGEGPLPERVLIVDDRKNADRALLPDGLPARLAPRVHVLRGGGAGPAAARNVGWRASTADWVAFLDDDVVPSRDWLARLADDLADADGGVVGTQGRVRVPLPDDRRPTDWERNVKNLERARWVTADMAYLRSALVRVGGFDERFSRAYREDADLGLRLTAAGDRIVRGSRVVTHPVHPAGRWVSVRRQAGNADDVLMQALHGRDWRELADAGPGRFPRHLAVTSAAVLALACFLARRRRVATLGAAAWAAGTAELAWARIAPGPRNRDEVATMIATSVLVPPAAVFHRLLGWISHRP